MLQINWTLHQFQNQLNDNQHLTMENETASCQPNSKPFCKEYESPNETFSLEEFLEKKIKRKNSMWSLHSDNLEKEPDSLSYQKSHLRTQDEKNTLMSGDSSKTDFTVNSGTSNHQDEQQELPSINSLPRKHSNLSQSTNVSEDMNNMMQHVMISWYYFFSLLWKIIKKVGQSIKNKSTCLLHSLFNLFFIFVNKVLRIQKDQSQFLLQSPRMSIFDQFLIFIYLDNIDPKLQNELSIQAKNLQHNLRLKTFVYLFTKEENTKNQTPFLSIHNIKEVEQIYQQEKKKAKTFVLLDSKIVLKQFQNIKIFQHQQECQNLSNLIEKEALKLFFNCQLIFHQIFKNCNVAKIIILRTQRIQIESYSNCQQSRILTYIQYKQNNEISIR